MAGLASRAPAHATRRGDPRARTGQLVRLVVAALAVFCAAGPLGTARVGDDDADLRARFEALAPKLRERVVERWRATVAEADGAQARRVRSATASLPSVDELPLERPPRWFDPEVHAPKQPIPRRLARSDEPEPAGMRERIDARHPARPERPAYRYDFGHGQVVRAADAKDPARLFHNGLLGRHPDWDLAEAAVTAALDDGSQRATLAAFGHTYTTREGVVHPGITLYDAWSSGLEAEMPDVDVLGIVHTVLGDRETWVAPIPSDRHAALYARLHELFQPARRLRSLAINTARAYLAAEPVLGDGFVPSQALFLHALWTDAADDPAAARRALPSPTSPTWNAFAGEWTRRLKAHAPLLEATREREAALAADRAAVREALIAALAEVEAERAPKAAPHRR